MKFQVEREPHTSLPIRGRLAGAIVVLAIMASACSQGSSTGASGTSKELGSSGHQTQKPSTVAKLAPRPSPGCSGSSHAELTLTKKTLAVDGKSRWYLLSTPPPPDGSKPSSLIFDFHGLAEGAQLEAVTSQLGSLGQKDGFMTAFPEGTGNPLAWDTSAGPAHNDDLDFVTEMLNQIEADECVDETRVYATGYSDGAFMTSLLACEMSDRIAAFAPVSGVQLPSPCPATRRIPILAFHGTADPILYFNGGVGTAVLKHALAGGPPSTAKIPPANLNGPGYPAAVAAWAKRDGCGADPVNTRVGAEVIWRVYRCPASVSVEFYIVVGGGHTWPGSAFTAKIASITGPTTFEINASKLIWSFLERFQV
jgi:polyhydroxybutyrate depolymerase